jgi:D-ribose pyranose/furanose isomerase RbsD
MSKKSLSLTENIGNKEKILDTILNNQSKELELKAKEINLKSSQDKNQLDFAKESLKSKIEIQKSNLSHVAKVKTMRYILSAVIVVVIASIIIYSLATGNAKFAEETIKALVFLAAGGFGGYGIKSIKSQQLNDN